MILTPTKSQKKLFRLLNDPKKLDVLVRGGARSGKTRGIFEWLIMLCCYYPGINILVGRLHLVHAKASLWNDTVKKAMRGREAYADFSEGEMTIYFLNGSKICIDGFDDKERVDKILGREYAIIYVNEASEVSYGTIEVLKSRLSQRIPGFQNKILYDMNPRGRKHWSRLLHIENIDPVSKEKLDDIRISQLGHIKMNATDNDNEIEKYLAVGYIDNILKMYSGEKRRRFLDGDYGDNSGLVFKSYEVVDCIPDDVKNRVPHAYGVDFGYTIHPSAVVDVYDDGEFLWIDEKVYGVGLRNKDIYEKTLESGCDVSKLFACDSAEQKSIDDLKDLGLSSAFGVKKPPGSVLAGIDKIQSRKIKITKRSFGVMDEFDNYSWQYTRSGEATGNPVDAWNHGIDAIRYALQALEVPGVVFL